VTEDLEIGQASVVVKVLLIVAGAVLALVALGLIPLATGVLHTSPWLLFAGGTVFIASGAVGILAPHRKARPAGHALAVALLVSALAISVGLATIYSHDERLAIGPWVFSGPRVDAFGKLVLGSAAAVQGAVAAWCWRLWWRALRRDRDPSV